MSLFYLQIVYDRPGFHSVANIYPEGFCSTRVYVDVNNPDNRCLYTCKISDGGKGPIVSIIIGQFTVDR